MTANEIRQRQQQTLQSLAATHRSHPTLSSCDDLHFRWVNDRIVVEGSVPSEAHRGEVLPMVRMAGVLCRIDNRVASVA